MEKLKMSYTKANTWKHCHLQYKYTYIDKLAPKEKSQALQVGDIVHRLIHLWITGDLTPKIIEDLDILVQKLNPENTEEITSDVVTQAASLIKGYFNKYQDDSLSFISSEVHIEHDLGPCILVMKVDAIARPEDGKLWRVEHKTTSRMDSYYLNGLKGGLQGALYDFGIEQTFKEVLSGTIYNILVKTKIPQYDRAYTKINRAAIDRALQTIEGVCKEIAREEYFPSSNCFGFNRECDYKMLCEYDTPEVRQAFYQERKEVKEDVNKAESGLEES